MYITEGTILEATEFNPVSY